MNWINLTDLTLVKVSRFRNLIHLPEEMKFYFNLNLNLHLLFLPVYAAIGCNEYNMLKFVLKTTTEISNTLLLTDNIFFSFHCNKNVFFMLYSFIRT